jgi:hypothetical protein
MSQELRRISHRKLENLINAKLIQTDLIPEEYYHEFENLKNVREYANYIFGGKMKNDIYNIKEMVSGMYLSTGRAFETALDYIFDAGQEIDRINGYFSYIPGIIGDDIGNDVYPLYLSKNDEERVVSYLISKGLTT